MRSTILIAVAIALSGCAAQRTADSVDADYRRGDRMAQLADERIACQRAGGIVLMRAVGRAASAHSRRQSCVRPGSLGLL